VVRRSCADDGARERQKIDVNRRRGERQSMDRYPLLDIRHIERETVEGDEGIESRHALGE
jgi:hypothetical protein